MKLALSLTLSFLLFAFVTKLPLAFSNDYELVLDVFGNPICQGGKYYMLPTNSSSLGGGLILGNTSYSECPLTVLSDDSVADGIPVRFSMPWTSCPCFIFAGIPVLEIEFTEKPPSCAKSSKWLMIFDHSIHCVGIGGLQGSTQSGLFSIQKYGSHYKLAYCSNPSPHSCTMDIGSWFVNGDDEGRKRLCVTTDEHDKPLEVGFIDAAYFDEGFIRSVA